MRHELISDRFEIQKAAGSGAMGTVYRARDRLSSATVAIKVIRSRGRRDATRFGREVRALSELDHPHVVRYLNHGLTPEGDFYIAMEWLEGESLRARLKRSPLSVPQALDMLTRVASAVGVAHARGVVHRDINPNNLFLVQGDVQRVKVLDFGVARLVWEVGTATETGAIVGTPRYMAPEQARGSRPIDPRVDVFALGCVLFECLTGQPLFAGEDAMSVLAKIVFEDAPRLLHVQPDAPPAVDDLIARMAARQRDQRPAHGAAVADEIRALGPMPDVARVPPAHRPAITTSEQRLVCVVLAARALAGQHRDEPTSMDYGVDALSDSTLDIDDGGPQTLDAPDATPRPDRETTRTQRMKIARDPGTTNRATPVENALRDLALRLNAWIEVLADGSVVATLQSAGSATDLAAQAARCAIAMRGIFDDCGIALATGRGELGDHGLVGSVIDTAARALRGYRVSWPDDSSPHPGRPVIVDQVTAGLLDTRFVVDPAGASLLLIGEREEPDAMRMLLGRPTSFVGRERELLTLIATYKQCVSEPAAQVALITAAAGTGKSRLRYELLRQLRERGDPIELWIARGDATSAGSPFGMLAQLVRRAAGMLEGEPVPTRHEKLRGRLERHLASSDVPRVTEFLAELVGAPFTEAASDQLLAARRDTLLMGDQMLRAWQDWIAAECSAQPLVIVLEDLHWGDLPTVKYIDSALAAARDRALIVIAAARPEVHEIFPRLWASHTVTELRLGPLSRRASHKLVREVLGESFDPIQIERLIERASGNVFYLEELIRATSEGKSEALPETVLAMLQSRIEAMDQNARRVLRAASVFGEVFWRGGVATLLGEAADSEALGAWLDALVDREVVIRRAISSFSGEEELVFRHALVRDAAYAMLTESDRSLGHRLAAQWLERAGEGDAAQLAEHYARGDEPKRAAVWYRHAAQAALEGNDLSAAVHRAERGIACGATAELKAELRMLQAGAQAWRGDTEDALRSATEALELAPRGSLTWCAAAAEIAISSGRLGQHDTLVEMAEALCEVAAGPLARSGHIIAALNVLPQLLSAARYSVVEAMLARVVEPARRVAATDVLVSAQIHRVLAMCALFQGDSGAYRDLFERAEQEYERAGNLRNACDMVLRIAHASMELGAYEEADALFTRALAGSERMGLNLVTAAVKHNYGLVRALQGHIADGRALELEALELFRQYRETRLVAAANMYLSVIASAAGDYHEAETRARDAVRQIEMHPPLRVYCLAALARALRMQGRHEEALEAAKEAIELVDRLGWVEEGESFVRLEHAEALLALGRVDEARDAIARARDRLLERAAKITNDELRRSFLERVADNARTLALASEHLGPTALRGPLDRC